MNEENRFMLMFTMGPVQPFIVQARKTRDLWIGSLLFSKLMEASMRDIEEEKGGEFIFPQDRRVEHIPDLPNKYIALFTSQEQARLAVDHSLGQIKKEWRCITQKVWKTIIAPHPVHDDSTVEIWLRQTGVDPRDENSDNVKLEALFEIYWVITERRKVDRSDDGEQKETVDEEYGHWLGRTDKWLTARKRLRDFSPGEEPGEKSAISGEREVLHGKNAGETENFWSQITKELSGKDITKKLNRDRDKKREERTKAKERLDAIDTVKRFAMMAEAILIDSKPFQQPFPSTSYIATAPFVEQLLLQAADQSSNELVAALKNWREVTSGKLTNKDPEAIRDIPYLQNLEKVVSKERNQWLLRRDGDLYFQETFVEKRMEEEYEVSDNNQIKSGNRALVALLKAACAPTRTPYTITLPQHYYAVIQMDGDKMGILLNKVADADEHRKINKALSDFARNKVPHIVEETYPARVVYAGGDDVLALAPLARDSAQAGEPSQVLELVDQLQEAYVKRVQGALQKDDKEGRQSVTASVGLTIAHHYTSLSYALRSARDAEGLAKHRYGRNSLVVTLLRRSGEQTRVGCHWSYPGLEPEGQPIQLFSRFYKLFKDDVLSPKCVYNLLEEAPALVKLAGPDKREFDSKQASSAMESEIKRVLKRQRASSKVNDFKDDELARYAWYIVRLAEAMDVAREEEEQKKAEEERRKGPPSTELYKDEWRYGLVEVLGWLLVMAFLARKEQEE